MANWQTKLPLKDVYHQEPKLPAPDLAKILAARLRDIQLPSNAPSFLADARNDIANEFESIAEDSSSNFEDFDDVMERLYNWADTPLDGNWNGRKLCWVETS